MPSKEQIAEYLSRVPVYGQGFGGNNYFNQFRNANNQLRALPNMEGYDENDPNIQLQESALRGIKGSAVAGGAITGLTGATTLLAGAQQAAHINDTSAYEGQLDDLSRAGNNLYNNYAELANDYAQNSLIPQYDYSQTRGMNNWEKAGSIGSSALTGAATGFQIGGLWGGVAGLGAGLLAGIGGVVSGDRKAEAKNNFLQNRALQSQETALANYDAAHERIRANSVRDGAVNLVAEGGSIKRQTMKEYADKVLRRPVRPSEPAPAKLTRSHGEGGTVIRIRVK